MVSLLEQLCDVGIRGIVGSYILDAFFFVALQLLLRDYLTHGQITLSQWRGLLVIVFGLPMILQRNLRLSSGPTLEICACVLVCTRAM